MPPGIGALRDPPCATSPRIRGVRRAVTQQELARARENVHRGEFGASIRDVDDVATDAGSAIVEQDQPLFEDPLAADAATVGLDSSIRHGRTCSSVRMMPTKIVPVKNSLCVIGQ